MSSKNIIVFIISFNIYNYSSGTKYGFFQEYSAPLQFKALLTYRCYVGTVKKLKFSSYQIDKNPVVEGVREETTLERSVRRQKNSEIRKNLLSCNRTYHLFWTVPVIFYLCYLFIIVFSVIVRYHLTFV